MHQLVNKTQIVGETCWIRFSLIADNQQKSPSWTEQILKKRGQFKVFYYSISFLWHFTYSSFVSQMNASFSKGPDYLWRWQRLQQKFKNPPDIYKYPLKFWQSCCYSLENQPFGKKNDSSLIGLVSIRFLLYVFL